MMFFVYVAVTSSWLRHGILTSLHVLDSPLPRNSSRLRKWLRPDFNAGRELSWDQFNGP